MNQQSIGTIGSIFRRRDDCLKIRACNVFNPEKNSFYKSIEHNYELRYMSDFIVKAHDSENHIIVFDTSDIGTMSINHLSKTTSVGALIRTDTGKLITVEKRLTFAFRHMVSDKIVLDSYSAILRKINILRKCLYPNEVEFYNRHVIDYNNVSRGKLRFLDIKNIYFPDQIVSEYSSLSSFLLPGGHMNNSDKYLLSTCTREVKEELGLDLKFKKNTFIYQNIFDKLNEKFYNNVLFVAEEVVKFEDIILSDEIKSVKLVDFYSLPPAMKRLW